MGKKLQWNVYVCANYGGDIYNPISCGHSFSVDIKFTFRNIVYALKFFVLNKIFHNRYGQSDLWAVLCASSLTQFMFISVSLYLVCSMYHQ